MRGRLAGIAVVVMFVFALGACGGGSSGGRGEQVAVTLTDYDMTFKPAVPKGKVTFDVQNDGSIPHEIVVVATDLPGPELPTDATGLFEEQASGVRVVDEATDLPAGASATLTVTLPRGRYVMVCNRPAEPGDTRSHFQHGMYQSFTVS